MDQEFEIMKVFNHHNRGQFIFARQLQAGGNFEVKDGSMLGGIPICNYVDMPRMLDENGQPRLDVFVFRPLLLTQIPVDHFQEGQILKLVKP